MDPNNSPDSIDGANAMRSVDCAIHTIQPNTDSRRSTRIQQVRNTPKTSEARRQASLHDEPVGLEQLTKRARDNISAPQTYLYLAYGSNLCALTFRERRGIQPLSQINVVVPEIALSFDLSGIPYTEPCFGNCRYRDTTVKEESDETTNDYHKNRWKKGLVGVVYEVTEKDYIHIIETEGGGSGYKDVLVDCYHLEDDPNTEVPMVPTSVSFKAHTLFAPARSRPDPSYAQPSARYKKLITDGAEECNLPHEYRKYLDGIRSYRITTQKQRLGLFIFALVWLPILSFIFMGAGKIFLGKDGLYPPWYVKFTNAVFAGVWASYDNFFKPLFGDGERTIKNGGSDGDEEEQQHIDQEKTPLLRNLRLERTKSSQEVV